MTLPNFLIIGQMKAGTTSLHEYLRQHPSIYMPALKEPRFFNSRIDDPTRPSWNAKGLPATLEEYAQLFDPVVDQTAIGEASPQYLRSDLAPVQIKRHLPGVRLIVSLRRPSDRLYSSYLMMRRIGRETRDFATAFRDEHSENRLSNDYTYPSLKRYYELFDRHRIKAIRFDRLAADRSATVAELFEFLGVDRDFPTNTEQILNEGGTWKNNLLGRISTSVRANRPLMQHLKRMTPSPIWRGAKALYASNLKKAAPIDAELHREINRHFREDTLRVQDLVKLDLSSWIAD